MTGRQKTKCISVSALAKTIHSKPDYLQLFLTPAEIRYCRSKKFYAEPAAARIAAKKAVLSLLRVPFLKQGLWARDIQVAKRASGKPFIKLSARLNKKFKLTSRHQWQLSLAHERDLAVAWVWVCEA